MMVRNPLLIIVVVVFGWLPAVRPCAAADEGSEESQLTPAAVEKILAQEVVVPEGVVYKKTTAEENRKAIEKLAKSFLDNDAKELPKDLFSSVLICGTGMWANIKDDEDMKKIAGGMATIRVPTDKGKQELEGKFFQNNDELAAFWRAFRRKFKPDPKAVVRPPTSAELTLYWAMIPYDITEPIFMIETKRAVVLAHFTNKELRIAWIDDFKNMRLEQPK